MLRVNNGKYAGVKALGFVIPGFVIPGVVIHGVVIHGVGADISVACASHLEIPGL